MSFTSPEIYNHQISLPITSEIRHIAEEFAARQPNLAKAEQVRLNTIAVLVVNNYLKMLGIETNLSASDSWNPVMQLCSDSADLAISGVGKLECRPVKSGANSCQIPLEVWDLAIGYGVVEIDDLSKEAKILGFVSQVSVEELPLNTLQPIEYLIDRIYELRDTANDSLVDLGNWLNNIFDAGWQTVESLFSPQPLTPALSFRNIDASDRQPFNLSADTGVIRAKEIDLGVQISDRRIVLLIRLIPEENNQIGVTLQIHPLPNETYLPETLNLKILEDSGEVFMEAQARSQDNFIQLQFSGQLEERFSVEIVLNEATFIEYFKL